MKQKSTVKSIEALEARVHFGSVIDEVDKDNTRFLVSKRGKPKMIMLSVNDYIKNFLKEDSLFAEIHLQAKKAGLDKITDEEIEAEIQAARKTIAERKKKKAK